MNKQLPLITILLTTFISLLLMNCKSSTKLTLEANYQLPPLGFESENKGVAGAFSGVTGDYLLIAGGANFPGKAPWEGGEKVCYSTGYLLNLKTKEWTVVEDMLPAPLGYGVSIQLQEGILCIGGNSKSSCSDLVFELKGTGDHISIDSGYPKLPVPLTNASGCLVDGKIYIAGGQESMVTEEATKHFFVLDLNEEEKAWKAVTSWPGAARGYAVSVSYGGKCYLFSGRDYSPSTETTILSDGYAYDPEKNQWEILENTFPVMAGTGFSYQDKIYLLGGSTQMLPGSFSHPGFNNTIRIYNPANGRIIVREQSVPIPVTTHLVQTEDRIYLTSGEIKPGIRTPRIIEGKF